MFFRDTNRPKLIMPDKTTNDDALRALQVWEKAKETYFRAKFAFLKARPGFGNDRFRDALVAAETALAQAVKEVESFIDTPRP